MRRNVAIATGIAAGVTALAVVATPAIAQVGPWSGARSTSGTTCPMVDGNRANPGTPAAGYGMGRGAARGTGLGQGATPSPGLGRGTGMQAGMGIAGVTTAPSGTLTADQKTSLVGMANEEKLAQDLYSTLAAKYPNDVQFARITKAESMHLAAVRTLLARYNIADPTAGLAVGTFSTAKTQSLYNGLLASAKTDASALAAGIAVEKDDIAALTAAKAGVTAPDVLQVYANLLAGSQRHLTAFGG